MKRAVLLILLIGAPLALALFPGFRRRVAHKLRFLLLVWAGAVLFFGLMGKPGKESLVERLREGDAPAAWALLGVALCAAAFFSVLRDFRHSSPSRKSSGAKRR